MPDREFVFSLEMSGEAGFEGLVTELTRTVLGSAGYAGDRDVLSGTIRQVIDSAGGHSHCVLRFQVRDGRLRIAVRCDGHATWQTSVVLPNS